MKEPWVIAISAKEGDLFTIEQHYGDEAKRFARFVMRHPEVSGVQVWKNQRQDNPALELGEKFKW